MSREISILEDLLAEYVREMSQWFDFHGTYDLTTFWPTGKAYLAWVNETPAGFALVQNNDVKEFFVRREFRRTKVGHKLAQHLWTNHPGPWTVRVLEANQPALNFWRSIVPATTLESECKINNRPWRILRFDSSRNGNTILSGRT